MSEYEKMEKFIKSSIAVPGYHNWKKAPEIVNFLKDLHRHLFKLTVTVEVTDSDREVEFFCLQNDIQTALINTYSIIYSGFDFTGNSCENIAETIANYLKGLKYNIYEVEVSEDGESSGIIRFKKVTR